MVKKHFCDKCGKDIEKTTDDFDEMFDKYSFGGKHPVNQAELCKKCSIGYKKIIDETNKKIADYIRD